METLPYTLVFGEFELDEPRRELRARGEPVRLDPKPLSLLLYLVRHRDRVVTKHELLDQLWPGVAVSESALLSAVKRLRLALGDSGTRPRLIHTLRGHGYRFVAPVVQRAPADSPPGGVPFVGRAQTLQQLTGALDAAMAGSGQVVLLAGEPGIGKTRLAEELARIARPRGVRVLNGWCYEGRGAPPFWPWVQILRALARTYTAERLRAKLGAGADALSLILPELREEWPALEPPVQAGRDELRFELLRSASSFLVRAAEEQPIALIVDDLHRADEPSLGLLAFLAHEIGHSAILVLGSYRDAAVDRQHPLSETLEELTRHTLFEWVRLGGLAPDEVRTLVGLLAGSAASSIPFDTVLEKTDGNPFFVTELVRFLTAGTAARTQGRAARGPDVPPAVREVILGRLARLSPSCNEALSVASVIGRDFTLEGVERASELDAETLSDAIDEGRKAGMISEGPGGDPRFAHVLLQEAVCEALGRARRARLHRRVAEWFEKTWPQARLDEQAALLAYHWEEAGDAGRAASCYHRASVLARERSAYAEAIAHVTRGLELLERLPDSGSCAGKPARCESSSPPCGACGATTSRATTT
jgi:predicted ATPase